MALKRKLTKAEHEKLSKDIQSEYIADGEGFRLDVDGDEDTGALKRGKDREQQLRVEAERKLAEAQAELDKITTNDALKNGDVKLLQKKWDDDKAALVSAHKTQLEKAHSFIKNQLGDSVAIALAARLNPNAPKIFIPHVKARIKADLNGEEFKTVILDKDGKASELTADQLYQEFVANPDFKGMIVGSKATGGAQQQNKGFGNSATRTTNDGKPLDLSAMKPAELAATLKANKESTAQQ